MSVVHPLGVGEVISSILDPNCVIAKDDESCTDCCFVGCATQHHTQLGHQDKGCAINGLGSGALVPARQSGPGLLSTVPLGMNRI